MRCPTLMRNSALLASLALAAGSVSAQSYFETIIDIGLHSAGYGVAIGAAAGNPGVFAAGSVRDNAGRFDALVVHLDDDGALRWIRRVGVAASDEVAYSVVGLPDGSCILAGETNNAGLSGAQIWMARIDALGNLLWSNGYGGSAFIDFPTGARIHPWEDGRFICVGRRGGLGSGALAGVSIVIDPSGVPISQHTYHSIVNGNESPLNLFDCVNATIWGPNLVGSVDRRWQGAEGYVGAVTFPPLQSSSPISTIAYDRANGIAGELHAVSEWSAAGQIGLVARFVPAPGFTHLDAGLAIINGQGFSAGIAILPESTTAIGNGIQDRKGGVFFVGSLGAEPLPVRVHSRSHTLSARSLGSRPAIGAAVADGPWHRGVTLVANGPAPISRWPSMSVLRTSDDMLPTCDEQPVGLESQGLVAVGNVEFIEARAQHEFGPFEVYNQPLAGASVACSTPICFADVDDGTGAATHDGGVDIHDLVFFLERFGLGDSLADIDNGTGDGVRDRRIDVSDLLFFLERFERGC